MGFFSSTEQVGFFDTSDKIIRIIFSLFVAISTVVMPRVANMYANKKTSKIIKLLSTITKISLLVLFPIVFILYFFSPTIVSVLLGNQFKDMVGILRLMSIMLPALAIANIMGNQILVPLKMIREYTLSIIYGAMINLVIQVPLIIYFSATGAAISVICAEIVVMCFQIKYSGKALDINLIFQYDKSILISGCILVLLAVVLSSVQFSFGMMLLISVMLLVFYVFANYRIIENILKKRY